MCVQGGITYVCVYMHACVSVCVCSHANASLCVEYI